eukprot:3563904-Rhodomonas_salina.1
MCGARYQYSVWCRLGCVMCGADVACGAGAGPEGRRRGPSGTATYSYEVLQTLPLPTPFQCYRLFLYLLPQTVAHSWLLPPTCSIQFTRDYFR